MADGTAATPKTPESKLPQLVPDTVPVPRSTSQASYLTGDLGLGREAVLQDLGRYLELPYETLVCLLFGPLPNIAQIREALLSKGVLVPVVGSDIPRWARFPVTPDASRNAEDVAFKPLWDIMSTIFEHASLCNVVYSAAPSETPLSKRKNTSRPDAYIAYKRHGSDGKLDSDGEHWWNIAVPFEFKRKNDDKTRDDNVRKIIWSLHNIMREDSRRRFALGITIEGTSMRVWYHNRAFLAVSTSIDLATAIDDTVSLFYSIACQDEEQLGWDPTIDRILDENGKDYYKFIACGETFTTTREIATYGADPMVSRGTRVYEAKDESGNIVAIKDSWRDADREAEGSILECIRRDIQEKFGEDEALKAMEYFVQIRLSEDVTISGKPDRTPVIKERPKWKRTPEPILSQKLHLPSTGHVPGSSQPSRMERHRAGSDDRVPQRIHTRTVFKDVGEALINVKNLSDCFLCLSGAVNALRYLHRAGWVHRDFSGSNVLWFSDDRVGKLSDFEYAKRFDSEGAHDVRTGTAQFMAVEVECQEYVFRPKNTHRKLGELRITKVPFRMNFLHDLESAWWTAMWTLFYHTDATAPTNKVDSQLRHFNLAFPPSVASPSRRSFFEFLDGRQEAWETLSETYRQESTPIVEFAGSLVDFYTEAEGRFPESLPQEEWERLKIVAHELVSERLSEVIKNLQGSDVLLQPLHQLLRKRDQCDDSPTQAVRKRSRQA